MEHAVSAGNVGIDLRVPKMGVMTRMVFVPKVFVYAYSSGCDMMKLISQLLI
jgi:hypothetical protein